VSELAKLTETVGQGPGGSGCAGGLDSDCGCHGDSHALTVTVQWLRLTVTQPGARASVSARPGGSLPVGVTGPDSALAKGAAGRGSLACGRPLPNSHADWLGWPGPARLGQPCVSKALRV